MVGFGRSEKETSKGLLRMKERFCEELLGGGMMESGVKEILTFDSAIVDGFVLYI